MPSHLALYFLKITDDYLVYPKPKPLGYESLIDMIVARTKYFDAIIDKHMLIVVSLLSLVRDLIRGVTTILGHQY